MREARRSRIAAVTLAAACGPSTGDLPSDESTSVGEAEATSSTSLAETTSADSTSTSTDNSSSGALDESTGAALQCPGGGQEQLNAGHSIDLSAWPSDVTEEGMSWTVDTDCTFVEVTVDDAANWHFSCVHPVEPSVELVLRLDCFQTGCDLAIAPGDAVHVETHVATIGPPENSTNEIWTVLRDMRGDLLFIGVGAQSLDFPGGPAQTAPLSFELAPLGTCAPTFECGYDEPVPIIVSAGRDSEVLHDSYSALIELDGRSYAAKVQTSCWREEYGYFGVFLIIPEPV